MCCNINVQKCELYGGGGSHVLLHVKFFHIDFYYMALCPLQTIQVFHIYCVSMLLVQLHIKYYVPNSYSSLVAAIILRAKSHFCMSVILFYIPKYYYIYRRNNILFYLRIV